MLAGLGELQAADALHLDARRGAERKGHPVGEPAALELDGLAVADSARRPTVEDAETANLATVGRLVTFLEYTRRVFEPIVVLGEQLNQVQRATASAMRRKWSAAAERSPASFSCSPCL